METGQAIQCTCTVYCLQTFPLQLGFLYQLVVLSRDGLQPSSIYSYNYTMYIAYTQLGFSINQQYCHRPGCSPHLYIVIICILPTHSWVSPSTSMYGIVTGQAVALIYTQLHILCSMYIYCLHIVGFLHQRVVLSRDGLQPSSIHTVVILCILPTHSWVSPSTSMYGIVTGWDRINPITLLSNNVGQPE